MTEPTLEFIGEQLVTVLREQAVMREDYRLIRDALAKILRTNDQIADDVQELRSDIAALKIEVRALADRIT